MVTCDVHSLARKGRRSRPSRGKETWLLILQEYMTSCRKRFRWMHRIWGEGRRSRQGWLASSREASGVHHGVRKCAFWPVSLGSAHRPDRHTAQES